MSNKTYVVARDGICLSVNSKMQSLNAGDEVTLSAKVAQSLTDKGWVTEKQTKKVVKAGKDE